MFRICCPCMYSDQGHEYTPISDRDPEFGDSGNRGESGILPIGPKSTQTNSPGKVSTPSPPAPPAMAPINSTPSNDQSFFHPVPDTESQKEFDLNSSVFKGMVVEQKFFNKSSYDPKFVWINLQTRSLCLSEHSIKERRHKEANIADITGVIAGPPEKYKASVNANGETIPLNSELCLSVKFVRGGGIDLRFPSTQERDSWYQVLTRLILQEKELRRTSSGLSAPTSSNGTSTTVTTSSSNASANTNNNSNIGKPQ